MSISVCKRNLSSNISVMEKLILTVKTRQEVADEYGICEKTLVSRLEAAGVILDPGIIFPKTLKIIYDTLGMPPNLKTS